MMWDAYRKWLKDVCEAEGTDPKEVWNEAQRKKEFLAQYRPRGRQSHYV